MELFSESGASIVTDRAQWITVKLLNLSQSRKQKLFFLFPPDWRQLTGHNGSYFILRHDNVGGPF